MERRAREAADDRDQVVVLSGVSWDQYLAIARTREKRRPRLAYLDGELELVTTSIRHELVKKLLARLIEAYADEREVELIGAGNATFKRRAKQAGLEADECYFLDRVKRVPDLAIEVVHTSGGVSKLEIYRRLEVREVWFWIDNELAIHRLASTRYGERYRKYPESTALRGIDLEHISELLRTTDANDQPAVVRAYRRSLRAS